MSKLVHALVAIAFLSALGSGCEGRKAHLSTEAKSHACLVKLGSKVGSYRTDINVVATKGAGSLEFSKVSRLSLIGVDLAFYPDTHAAQKLLGPAGRGKWHHPHPALGVEFDRFGNVLEFWHQAIPHGRAPSAAERTAVARCLR